MTADLPPRHPLDGNSDFPVPLIKRPPHAVLRHVEDRIERLMARVPQADHPEVLQGLWTLHLILATTRQELTELNEHIDQLYGVITGTTRLSHSTKTSAALTAIGAYLERVAIVDNPPTACVHGVPFDPPRDCPQCRADCES